MENDRLGYLIPIIEEKARGHAELEDKGRTVKAFFKKDNIKSITEETKESLSKILPDAVKTVGTLVKSFDVNSDDIELNKLSYRATCDLLKGLNVYNNPKMNINIQNNSVILPEVLTLLQKSAAGLENIGE